jgi:two-component system sensor histidine kinase/response regulator
MNKVPTILLIDDDPDFVDATCTVLESVPYKVLVAYSGSEGLAKAQETPPDLIILDVIMPVEDGFQILERLRDDRALAHIPVMMLTSLLDGLSVASMGGTNAAIADYVEKPVKPAELLRRIGELLEGQETQ